jgi:sugar phosphate isomerase/epimerase
MGADAVELPVDGRWPAADVERLLERPQRLTELVDGLGLTISALSNHWDSQLVLGPHTEDTDPLFRGSPEEKTRHGARRTLLACELAGVLGVSVVCGFVGCPEFSRWFPWPNPRGWESMEAVFAERWAPIIDHYARGGIRFAHECHPKQMAYSTETAVRATELMEHSPAWGYNLDPANLMVGGVDPVGFAAELGSRVWNVHGKDYERVAHNAARSGTMAHGDWARPDRGFRFRIPGWGNVAWRPLITELHLRGFDGHIALEHEDPTMGRDEGVRQGMEFLAPLLLRSRAERTWW